MRKRELLAGSGKNHLMLTDDISATKRMHSDFLPGTLTDHSVASVRDIFLHVQFAHSAQDFRKLLRRAARCVFLQAMMHLDDFEIEIGTEQLGRLASEPEKRVHSHAEVRREYDRY